MKAQRVELFVCPMATPADTTGLQKLADEGKIKPETLVALVGKTEGTGAHDDWGRVWADVVLREWTGKFLSIPASEVAKQVIFVLSGGCRRRWRKDAGRRPGRIRSDAARGGRPDGPDPQGGCCHAPGDGRRRPHRSQGRAPGDGQGAGADDGEHQGCGDRKSTRLN